MEEANERRAERKRKQKEEADAKLAAKKPVGRPHKPIPLAPPAVDGGDDDGGDADGGDDDGGERDANGPRGPYNNWKTPEFFPFIVDTVRRFKEVRPSTSWSATPPVQEPQGFDYPGLV